MRRRSFFKFGLTATALGVIKPVKATRIFECLITSPTETMKPIVISTWEHGLAANDNAWKILKANGPAIDAVELGVRTTESDITNRSVGIGGRPDRDGHVTLDACIMDENSNCGAVGCLEGIKHPISVARKIMENTPHIMLVGEGAKSFALDYGFKHVKSPIKEVKQEWRSWKKIIKNCLKSQLLIMKITIQ
jgi:N4-(beta-N-acetylglucosaminyl)-L-asparaginase